MEIRLGTMEWKEKAEMETVRNVKQSRAETLPTTIKGRKGVECRGSKKSRGRKRKGAEMK